MKNTDKLTLLADLIDDELIDEAIRAGEKNVTAHTQKSRVRRTALIAVCAALAIIICAVPLSYFLHTDLPAETTDTDSTLPTPGIIIPDVPDGETIDSLDKLNYYGGIMSILQSEGKNFARFAPGTPRLSLLSGGGDTPETIPNIPEDITIRYTFNEHDTFTVSRALYFKVNLTADNFFLSDRLGTGEAEVVITSNNIADMITFRKDGRYYSCVLKDKSASETGEICYVFTTDNYIDGPYLINHSSPETVDFCVYVSDAGIRMDSRKIHWDNVYAEIGIVNGSYIECNITLTLTVAEISAFFNFKTATETPALDGDVEHIFCGRNPEGNIEIYIVIYESGGLLWCNEAFLKNRDDPAAYSRSGEITYFTREFIVFHYIDPQGKKVICNTELNNSGGFEFMGMTFERRNSLEFDRSEEDTTLRYVTREDSGMNCEIVITNGARYVINDLERGVTIDRGSVRQESDGKSFTLISDPDTGNFDELYITPFEDGSIEYRRIRFYPEDSTN